MNRKMSIFGLVIAGAAVPGALFAQTLQPGFTVSSPGIDSITRLAARPVPMVDVFASGAVRDAAAKGDTPAAVNGALGLRYRGAVFVVAGLINIASKEDTLRSDFGSSILPPSAGHALNAGLLDIRAPRFPSKRIEQDCSKNPDAIACHIGLHAYFSASSTRWATTSAADGTVLDTRIVPAWGSGLGLTYTFVNGMLEDSNQVGMVLDVGLATRSIRGDIAGMDSVRTSLLGTDSKNFIGGEFSFNLQYNTIQAGLTYYYMTGDVAGFSRGQIVAGVSLQSNLNSKRIKR